MLSESIVNGNQKRESQEHSLFVYLAAKEHPVK